jgi:hypothetical protein
LPAGVSGGSTPEHVARHRPAQPRLAHRDAADHAPGQVWRKSASRDFDFWKFGHLWKSALVRGTKYT